MMCAAATTPEYPYGKLHGVFRLPWFRRTWVSNLYNPCFDFALTLKLKVV